jgi:hypothetical protein
MAGAVSTNITNNAFRPQAKKLASVLRGFQSSVTPYACKNAMVFDWKARFHDHIIRNEDEYHDQLCPEQSGKWEQG